MQSEKDPTGPTDPTDPTDNDSERLEIAFLIAIVASVMCGMLQGGFFGPVGASWIYISISTIAGLAAALIHTRTWPGRCLLALGYVGATLGALFATTWYVADRSSIIKYELVIPIGLGAGPGLLYVYFIAPLLERRFWPMPKQLFDAVQLARDSRVKLLLKRGLSIDQRDDGGKTPLHWAAMLGIEDIVTTLLLHGAKVDEPEGKHGYTPLIFACIQGHVGVIRLLLKHKASIEAKGLTGKTALHLAAFAGQKDVVLELLDQGANIDASDDDQQTPLSMARHANKDELVSLLEQQGART